jgi:ribosome biogenesis protein Tsr3
MAQSAETCMRNIKLIVVLLLRIVSCCWSILQNGTQAQWLVQQFSITRQYINLQGRMLVIYHGERAQMKSEVKEMKFLEESFKT